jgi:two-component system, cell cycle sensor histidine kinase and response regulator CckA
VDTLLRVLIVEDSAADTELVVREVERGGYRVDYEQVETADALQRALKESTWDVVISDYDLPRFSGPAALATLQATGLDIPFIIISGTIREEVAVSALKAGAHDFIVKGRLARLIPAIERERREVEVRATRARAEDALRQSEAQYRSLFDGAVFGIFQATADGEFVAVNPALVTMLGYDSAEELLRIGWVPLHADPGVATALLSRSDALGPLIGEEVIWRRKDGQEIRVRLSGRLVDGPHLRRTPSEVIVEDITERHRLESQLRQAQKMEAIGLLAGGVAHDFNNMLTAILGYSELLTEQIGPDKPIGRDLREIKVAAERAAVLTKQLLAFSRKQVFALLPVDLTRVVGNLKPMLQRLLGERITIATTLADDVVPVMADVAQLEHLLINLSVNARDAMPQGGTLTFTTASVILDATFTRDHPGAHIGPCAMVSVADTGQGMAPDLQARIFEPFFTTKESGRGTGLGLAAAYGTVKQFGGYIGVESAVGHGTTFSIYLPKSTSAVGSPGPPPAVSTHVGNETILLVEDESGVRSFVKTALQRFGYHVIEAESAEAALILLEGYDAAVHLLLADLVLPGMDGAQLAKRVMSMRPDVRVLFMSGYARGAVSAVAGLDPSIDLLQKPFTAQTLLTKTRETLGLHAEEGAL